MKNFELKTLYLDKVYKDIFERYLIRKKMITKSFLDDKEQRPENLEITKCPLVGLKKLFILLTLFEDVNSNSSIYNFDRLIDVGLVKENNTLGNNENEVAYTADIIDEAVRLMKTYKRDIVKFIKRDDRELLRYLSEKSEAKEFWKNVDRSSRMFICTDINGNPFELNRDFDAIVEQVDDLYSGCNYFESRGEGLLFDLFQNRSIELDIGSIRDNLIEGLYYSKNNSATFVSGIFSNTVPTKITDCVDSVYYTVQARLPNEINILPMPQSLDEVLKMRKSPYIKSFRNVMNEWSYYVGEGEYKLAEKIKKDLIIANRQLDHLDRYKRFSQSPYTRVFNVLGGFVPYLNVLLCIINLIEPYVTECIQEKNQWVLLTKDIL